MVSDPFAECWVCGGDIQHSADAILAGEDYPDYGADDPGEVRYRHEYCDPRDREHVPTMWM
jgi:hypothetical protein